MFYSKMLDFVPDVLRLPIKEWRTSKWERQNIKPIDEVVAQINARWPGLFQDEVNAPIFLFSAGWRSGSTLLQRLVMSDSSVMMWGEPYKLCNIVSNQINSLQAIGPGYPPDDWFIDHYVNNNRDDLSNEFVANLYPPIKYMWDAHRAFFTNLMAQSALDQGYSRWGFKEVRLGVDSAHYLKWLFPKAKFLFIYRNPYKAYASLRPNATTWSLYENWPDKPVRSPYKFGRLWNQLVTGYLEGASKVGGVVIKYEDLCKGGVSLENMEEYLGIKISKDILNNKIGGTKDKQPLSKVEKSIIRQAVNPLAESLGY